MDAPNPRISLRTYVYIDSLQPQLAEYMATVSQGFLPVPGDACLWIEVSPGMAVHRLTDTALKATRVHLAQQVVERAYGSMVIHQRDQSDVREAGRILLRHMHASQDDRETCRIAQAHTEDATLRNQPMSIAPAKYERRCRLQDGGWVDRA